MRLQLTRSAMLEHWTCNRPPMRLQSTGGAMPGTTGAAPYPCDTRSATRAAAGGRDRSVPLKAQYPRQPTAFKFSATVSVPTSLQ